MRSRSEFSAQTLSVLSALCEEPSQWRHGYALAGQTGLKSGTLYPILIRLADRGLVEACWQEEPAPGRPRRHLYRLTAAGLASASGALASASEALGSAARPGGAGGADGPQCGDTGGAVSGLSPGGAAIWLSRAAAAAGRGALRLVPAGRRDWAEAIWAEAYEVPSGFRRLAWRAGGVQVIAREALMARKIGRWLLFAAAAALAARATWPGPPGRFATAIARMDVVTIVLLLAGLPLLARWFLGPASNSRLARFLRAGGYAAVLALMVAKASVLRAFPPRRGQRFSSTGSPRSFSWSSWPGTWPPSSL